MAITSRHSSSDVEAAEKNDYSVRREPSPLTEEGHLTSPENEKQSLHRGLQSRQISMIALGGSIGTGLIIGTGSALARAGYVNDIYHRSSPIADSIKTAQLPF